MLTFTILTLTAFVLGLFAGSLLTEAVILVPYWRSLAPKTFLDLHSSLGPLLYKFFAPLTIAATVMPVVSAIYCVWTHSNAMSYAVASAALILCTFCLYFYYFKSANASFASGAVGVDGLADELRRWSIWHWLRTVVAMAALYFALVAIAVAG